MRFYGCPEGHLDQVWRFLSVQGVFGQLVSAGHPGVSEDLPRSQPPVGVHMQHLGHQILVGEETFSKPGVLPRFAAKPRFCSHLCFSRNRVPVPSCQGELPAADPGQNLLRSVLWAVSKRSEANKRRQREKKRV